MHSTKKGRGGSGGKQPDGDIDSQDKPEETCLKLYAVTDERFRSITSATSAGLFFVFFSFFLQEGVIVFPFEFSKRHLVPLHEVVLGKTGRKSRPEPHSNTSFQHEEMASGGRVEL